VTVDERSIEDVDEDVRLAVYRSLAAGGRAPSEEGVAAELGLDHADVQESLRRLHEARHLVLDVDGDIVMAHPFATVPLGFAVMGAQTLWWGGCAWDSFALPHLLPDEPVVLVATRCPACERALAWNVDDEAPPVGDEVAHLLVPTAHIWDDVVHTCSNQRLFCNEACVDDWLAVTGNERGYVMDLAQLWRLAQHWYDGRLDRGYERREPTEAKAYFHEVGLQGEFWGLG
jgi:hypothetical protein